MSLAELIAQRSRILTEGSVYELLRRDTRISFDSSVAHAGLIYDTRARGILADIHRRYLEIARVHELPIIAFTDTWRASAERVAASPFAGRHVNRDNVSFLREIAAGSGAAAFVAGMSGPHGDAYVASEAPPRSAAIRIHRPQIKELAGAGVDLLFAATLPALDEAMAIGELMAATRTPWMLSFVVRETGTLLDGTPLEEAVLALDRSIRPRALGFSINCIHPAVALSAISALDSAAARRIVAFQGNSSALSPEELDGRSELHGDGPRAYARSIARLAPRIPVIGGCCGTGPEHMEVVAEAFATLRVEP